jgi:hypothetical protein
MDFEISAGAIVTCEPGIYWDGSPPGGRSKIEHQSMDPVLIPVIEAREEEERREEVARLIVEHARPTIEAVVARFSRSDRELRHDDAEEILATATLRLVRKLLGPDRHEVRDFENYVASLTYRTVYDFLRRRFPERTRLKNRVRYLLEHDRRFAVWPARDSIACGLATWRGRGDVRTPFSIAPETASPAMIDASRPHDAVAAVFERAGSPLSLETLVGVLARLWNIADARPESTAIESVMESRPTHAVTHESRQFLRALWDEIKELQPSHRAALLLNLRDPDGVNAVALFALVGVADLDEIASALNMSVDELEAIWESLPLDDLAIAARLDLTRQQVINLRRTARERLARGTFMSRKYERRRG